jgi:transcription-repair coupling factor (superfamily II helicase)
MISQSDQRVEMPLETLVSKIIESSHEFLESLHSGERIQGLGLRRSARLPVVASVRSTLNRPILFITDRADNAFNILDELNLWLPETSRLYFPEPMPLFYEQAAWGENTRRDRLAVITTLAGYHIPGVHPPVAAPIIIAPIRAIMTRTLPRRRFLKTTHTIKPGQAQQPEGLARAWINLGYEPVNTVIAPGQFARRGGILDVWPPAEQHPVRIEFFGDEVDTLRNFDPSSQRTLKTIERLLFTPAREFLLDSAAAQKQFDNRDQYGEEIPFSEFHIPLLEESPATVLDYLPSQALVFLDDLQNIKDTVSEIEEQAVNLRKDFIQDETLPSDFPVPYISWTEIEDSLGGRQVVELGPGGSSDEVDLGQRFAPGSRFAGRLKDLMNHLVSLYLKREVVVIVSRQTARLQELWEEQAPVEEGDPAFHPSFVQGSLSEGWTFTPTSGPLQHLLSDGEIFGWKRPEARRRRRPAADAPEAAYADLQVDDWVVHVDHGIGRFVGLVTRKVDGLEREYLCVEYAENDQLFVPVYQADRLTRYVGPDGREPSQTRLGSAEWRSVKSRAKEAVEEVAEELLDLYAMRQVIRGHAFNPDVPWQQELEASFPYIETEDQLRVIREVKQDMESDRPMDRLICGDVGYGKTEVALRAAFKAVLEGKQVAVLVPTTVLAQQHFYTFRERLATFPVEVEMLSRFRTQQQQRDIIYRLAQGTVDIVIGTHRLIQGDVNFKDLGLLIIDEEQRFGVTHKETLKKMRTEVDVLTLTATPIPRTLYMALTGVRDISTINTPPEERLPIVTHVGPYAQKLVRQAILRELERGGQVFFVHNRVHTIQAMRSHLERLVPEARIAVAHGQMAENELSARMEQFTAGEVDVLLSTSIIESGLDIPNANTLIVDRADTFGLAQLYQLRGRVGRGAQRAYAYFFRHRRKLPTLEGRQRLETIAENTQLGAGYSIAMRDLEIRGAGDLLGTRQHGYIAAVGFHLYTRLLAEAVHRKRESRQLPAPLGEGARVFSLESLQVNQGPPVMVSVDLPLHIGIPPEYAPNKNLRLRLYRRIAGLRSLQEADALVAEFIDRFGPLPEQVENLLYQLKVKLLAEKASVISISSESKQIVLRFAALPEGLSERAFPNLGPDVRASKNSLWLPLSNPNWRELLLEVLTSLAENAA